jgi:diguanylate cyclase (GGDEF)-like protein
MITKCINQGGAHAGMNERCERWKVRDLAWRKRYKRYRDEVLHYELYALERYAIYNTLIFLAYGLISFLWNRFILKAPITGSMLCAGVSLFCMFQYGLCKLFLERHTRFVAIAANAYILILGKMLLSIDLIWNDRAGGSVSWTLLVCSLIMTSMISIVPSHYGIAVAGVVALDTIECMAAGQGLLTVMYNLLDGLLVMAFCISMNIIYSGYQYAEFSRKEELTFESNRDVLTQLYNRRYLERYYGMHAEKKDLCAMIVLDLDNFKMANDVFGHDMGDKVLCTVGEVLRKSFRSNDCVARLGGDEFAVFLCGITDKEALEDRVHSVLEKFPIVISGDMVVEVSVSMGIAYKHPGEEMDYTAICNEADEAMYRAKNLGKGKAVVSARRSTRDLVIVA